MKRAVVAGHICLDIIPAIDHHFNLDPGRLYEVGAATIATGGAVSNTGVALHRLGIPTTLMGKIGADSFGRSILDVLRSYDEGLADGMVIVDDESSSYTVVVNIPGVDRMFLHCPGANNSFVADDIDTAKVAEADLFHFGYPAFMAAQHRDDGREFVEMYRRVKALGVTTSLDMGMPDPGGAGGKADWQGILSRVLPLVDIFMPSADELLYALNPKRFGAGDNLPVNELASLADRLLEMGSAVVAIKLGARGMYIRTAAEDRLKQMGPARPADLAGWASRELWFPIFREERFLGATGAGDTTIAGFLAALLREWPIEECGRVANAVGACNVEASDALGGIRSWEETTARMAAGWAHVPLAVSEPGWSVSECGVLHGPRDARA